MVQAEGQPRLDEVPEVSPPPHDISGTAKEPKNGRPLTGPPVFSLPRRGNALRGRTFLLVQKDPEERARQREGLFTKPPFPLESHPPKIASLPHLTDAVRVASLCSARAIIVRQEMSEDGLHRELACGYAKTTPACHSERSEESCCKLTPDSSSLALLRMTRRILLQTYTRFFVAALLRMTDEEDMRVKPTLLSF